MPHLCPSSVLVANRQYPRLGARRGHAAKSLVEDELDNLSSAYPPRRGSDAKRRRGQAGAPAARRGRTSLTKAAQRYRAGEEGRPRSSAKGGLHR